MPDPSWEWAWPEWRVNHDVGSDDGGWEYSFMFSKRFSWHGPKWYNSFVRRRAWIRKRVKKGEPGHSRTDPHLLNPDYFTVQPVSSRRRSGSSRASSFIGSRASISQMSNRDMDLEEEQQDIEDVETLMPILRRARIDRERIEAIENFLQHGEEELVHLQDEMHEIMSLFIFQASRQALLARLTQVYDETVKEKNDQDSPRLQRRAENLAAAIKHADEEVRRLEYWSDMKALTEGGDPQGNPDDQLRQQKQKHQLPSPDIHVELDDGDRKTAAEPAKKDKK